MNAPLALDIAEVARRSRLPASTLRCYEEIGLIHSVGRHGLRRIFKRSVLDQLTFITLGRNAGFTLRDLAEAASTDGKFTVDRKKVRRKADELDRKIKQLKILSTCLRHVADCPAEDHFTCPNFQKRLRQASRHR